MYMKKISLVCFYMFSKMGDVILLSYLISGKCKGTPCERSGERNEKSGRLWPLKAQDSELTALNTVDAEAQDASRSFLG